MIIFIWIVFIEVLSKSCDLTLWRMWKLLKFYRNTSGLFWCCYCEADSMKIVPSCAQYPFLFHAQVWLCHRFPSVISAALVKFSSNWNDRRPAWTVYASKHGFHMRANETCSEFYWTTFKRIRSPYFILTWPVEIYREEQMLGWEYDNFTSVTLKNILKCF